MSDIGESKEVSAGGGAGSPTDYYGGKGASTGKYYGYFSANDDRPIRDYVAVFYQFRYLIAVLGIIGAVIGNVMHSREPLVFQANALVNVTAYIPAVDGPTAEMLRNESSKSEYMTSLIPMLASYTIADLVLSQNKEIRRYLDPNGVGESQRKAAKKKGDTSDGGYPVWLLDAYLGSVSGSIVPGTNLVHIQGTSGIAEMATKLANAQSEGFISLVRKQRHRSASVNHDFLRARMDEISKRVEIKEKELLKFVQTNSFHVTGDDMPTNAVSEKFRGLVSNLSQAVLERASSEGELRELRSSSGGRRPILTGEMQGLFLKLTQIESDYELIRRQWENHPALRTMKSEIRTLETALKEGANQAVKSADVKYRAAQKKEEVLRDELASVKEGDVKQTSLRMEYKLLEKELQAEKNIYQEMKKRFDDSVLNAQNNQQNVTLVDPAKVPPSPINKPASSHMITGGFFGILLGIALALVFDYLNNSVCSAQQLRKIAMVGVLGSIPSFSSAAKRKMKNPSAEGEVLRDEIDRGSDNTLGGPAPELTSTDSHFAQPAVFSSTLAKASRRLVTVAAPLSRESEAFRNVRTTLRYSGSGERPQTIMVTSGQKSDGKTTVAANLAVSIAAASSKTILIDADMRLPTVHNYFGIEDENLGLADYLCGALDFKDLIRKTGVPNLDLITAGTRPSSPAELLETKHMMALLDVLAQRYDYILIDTPPVAHVTDALLLARKVDGVLLVVRSNKTSRPIVEFAANRLREIKVNIIGAVLNDVKHSHNFRDAEYYSRGKYGKGYYNS